MNVRHFETFAWTSPLINLSLDLKGRVVTKGRKNIIFAKSQPPFGVHRQYLDVSPTMFCGFLQNLARLSSVFIFKKLSANDFLVFRVI